MEGISRGHGGKASGQGLGKKQCVGAARDPQPKLLTGTRRQQGQGPRRVRLPEQSLGHVRRAVLRKHNHSRNATVSERPGQALSSAFVSS